MCLLSFTGFSLARSRSADAELAHQESLSMVLLLLISESEFLGDSPWTTRNLGENVKRRRFGASVCARSTLGDLDSGLEGAESAKREETPWSIYDGPLAAA